MNGWPVVVLKACLTSRNTAVESSGNADDRWSSMARSIARRIRSGTFVGPGTNRKLRPAMAVVLEERGSRVMRERWARAHVIIANLFRNPRAAIAQTGRGYPPRAVGQQSARGRLLSCSPEVTKLGDVPRPGILCRDDEEPRLFPHAPPRAELAVQVRDGDVRTQELDGDARGRVHVCGASGG